MISLPLPPKLLSFSAGDQTQSRVIYNGALASAPKQREVMVPHLPPHLYSVQDPIPCEGAAHILGENSISLIKTSLSGMPRGAFPHSLTQSAEYGPLVLASSVF